MGPRPKNANQRRLEQLRAVREEVLPEPSVDELIEAQQKRIAELEAEVDRLRQLLRATRPRSEATGSDAESTTPSRR